MPLDSVVYAPGREHRYVYFPNRHHSVDQQLRRWLLLSLARLTGDHLNMTQGVCECYAVLKKR